MDETTIDGIAIGAAADDEQPLYLSNCDPGDEADERASRAAESRPLAA
jgi:hypothetical protein